MVAKRHRRRGRGTQKKLFVFMVLLLILTILFLELRLKPIVTYTAKTYAQSLATTLINQSVADVLGEMNITGEELDTISRNNDGSITSISSNTVLTNKLKSAVTLRVQENIVNICGYRVDVPLGTVIGGELINGRGPSIPIYISLSGNVDSDFVSEFESGGVNQTVHKLSIRVCAKITVVMTFSSAVTEVETSVPVSENVIVGNVPSGMIYKDTNSK